jgi:mannose-6-phosphate isomerase-like protein (cupin superfamily)
MTDAASTWFFDTVEETALDDERGQVALVERHARAGAMAPLHRRPVDESYRVQEGTVTFFVDGERVPAGPGDVVVAPAGSARTFRVESAEARWLVLTRVTSLTRYEDFGRAVAQPIQDYFPTPDELSALRAIGAANGIEVLGPPGAVSAVV